MVSSKLSNSLATWIRQAFNRRKTAGGLNSGLWNAGSREKAGQLLSPPVYVDPNQDRLAKTFHTFLLVTVLICLPLSLLALLEEQNAQVVLAITGTIFCAAISSLYLIHIGRLFPAGRLFLGLMWLIITYIALQYGAGLSSPAIGGYLVVILGTALFFGARASIVVTGFSVLSIGFMFIAELSGLTSPAKSPSPQLSGFVTQAIILTIGLVLINIAIKNIQAAHIRTRAKEEELVSKNQQLQEVLATLEARIAERTREILEQKQFYEALMVNSPIAIVTLDNHHKIQACNPAFEKLFGYAQGEILGQELDNLITDSTTHREANLLTRRVISGEMINRTTRRRRKDGVLVDVEISGVPVLVNGQQIGVLALYKDISEQVRTEGYLKFLATHDPLTVLPNRALFYEHLNRAIATAKRNKTRLAVYFLDLDGFKAVNDLFGHIKGDELLQEIAARFRRTLRGSDLVARLGGDEFAFVCQGIHTPDNAGVIARKILNVFSSPFTFSGMAIAIYGSLGISLFPEDGEEARTLLTAADKAMYCVKGLGKNHYRFYSHIEACAEEPVGVE